MAATLRDGQISTRLSRDKEGHRSYWVEHFVDHETTDGPFIVLNCPGLPEVGSVWSFDDDLDTDAYCKQDAEVSPAPPHLPGDPVERSIVKQLFSTKPDEKRCKQQTIEDPLLIPDRVSGSFDKFTEEATLDRFGDPILTSSHEQVRGPQVEFDSHRMSIVIEQNVPQLQLSLLYQMNNTVNDRPIYGVPTRFIKLTVLPWEKKYYGQCSIYFVRKFQLELYIKKTIDGTYVSGWDRDVVDEGTKVLHGHWDPDSTSWIVDDLPGSITPDRTDPSHFQRFQDRKGDNSTVILDGFGTPFTPSSPLQQAASATVSSGGSGYQVGDLISLSGGTYNTQAGFIVTGVTGFGIITSVEVVIPGSYRNPVPTNPVATSGGSAGASGCTLSVTWEDSDQPGIIHIEKYGESNLLLLNLPTQID